MNFFRNIFSRRKSSFTDTILNPLLGMKLQEFVVAGDSMRVKHYFRFKNKEGKDEEFVVCSDCFDGELIYSRTLYRRTGEADFSQLGEPSGWSISISHLIELGRNLSAKTRPAKDHFTSRF
jgi:hypothetical protein